jgi:hypothetical protein
MKRKEFEGKEEKYLKKSYFGETHNIREEEMKKFSEEALKIQKNKKLNSEEDTPQLVCF